MKGIMKALACITLILYFLSACNNHISFADLPDIRLFYCSSEESMSNIPRIYNIKTGESEKITIEGYEDIYISDACGYSDGEFFAFFETKDECKILKVRSGEVIASHDFEAEYKAPESWEYACRSILAIERYKDGVLVLSPSVDPYTDEPFYADIPSTLYYIDFNGLCEPIIENVISFKVYKDKICYSTFDETRLVEYGNTTIYSRFNISIYENGESCELISSENCGSIYDDRHELPL